MATNRSALLTAARDFMRAVPSVGVVADCIGQEPTWEANPNSQARAFWQVYVPQVARHRYAGGRNYARRLTLLIVGDLPWNKGTRGLRGTEEGWMNLVDAVMDALGSGLDVVGSLVEGVEDLEPQLQVDDVRPFAGEKYTALCHHCEIILTIVEDDGP
jgi:hypothetical protein